MDQFIFGGNTGVTYGDLLQRRKRAEELLAANQAQTPQGLAGAIGAIGTAFIGRNQRNKAEEELKARNKAFSDAYTQTFRNKYSPSGDKVTAGGRAAANQLMQSLGVQGEPAMSTADRLMMIAGDSQFSDAQRDFALQMAQLEMGQEGRDLDLQLKRAQLANAQRGPDQFEVVNNPYGMGGSGQRNTTTGQITGYQRPNAPQTTSNITEFRFAKENGFTGTFQEFVAQKNASSSANKFGGTPIYGQLDGRLVVGQLNDRGGVRWDNVPQSRVSEVQVTRPIRTIDQGTSTALVNSMTGNVEGSLDKNLGEVEVEKAVGKDEADAQINYGQNLANAEMMLRTIDGALNHPGLESAVGNVQGNLPNSVVGLMNESAADFITYADQLQGKTFLEAYQGLRGGGQITEVEGKKAEAAIARLNRAQSEESYKAALRELREITISSIGRMRDKAGGGDLPSIDTNANSAPAVDEDAVLRKYGLK